jgi:hypothetical protein
MPRGRPELDGATTPVYLCQLGDRRIPGGPSWPESWGWKVGERRPRRPPINDRPEAGSRWPKSCAADSVLWWCRSSGTET